MFKDESRGIGRCTTSTRSNLATWRHSKTIIHSEQTLDQPILTNKQQMFIVTHSVNGSVQVGSISSGDILSAGMMHWPLMMDESSGQSGSIDGADRVITPKHKSLIRL